MYTDKYIALLEEENARLKKRMAELAKISNGDSGLNILHHLLLY